MSPKKNKIRKAVSKEQKLENAAIARFTRILSRAKYQEHGLAKPKAKPAKGPMRPEHDNVRMKSGLGLKQPPKQRQGLLTNHSKKKELVVVPERSI